MDGNNLKDLNSTLIDNNRFGDIFPRVHGRFIGANKNLYTGLQSKIFIVAFFTNLVLLSIRS